MTDNELRQSFGELEYMIQKYFNEHCAAVVSGQAKYFRDQRVAEYRRNLDAHPVFPGQSGFMNAAMVAQETSRTGEWSKKTTDDLIKSITDKFKADPKLAGDLRMLEDTWKAFAIEKLGKKEYDRLSKGYPGGDMAKAYVDSRVASLVMEQLARSKVPQSSLQYITQKGFSESFLGMVCEMTSGVKKTDADERIEAMAERFYDPSTMERVGSTATSIGIDLALFRGPVGLTGKTGTALRAAKASNTVQAVAYGADVIKGMLGPSGAVMTDEVEKQVSSTLFGNRDSISTLRNDKKVVKPSQSLLCHNLNEELSQKVKLPAFRIPYSPHQKGVFQKALAAGHGDDVGQCRENVLGVYSDVGFKVSDKKDPPAWMLDKSESELLRMSDWYVAEAMELKRCHKSDQTIGGRKYTVQEIAQKGYDYARAAVLVRERQQAVEHEEERTASYDDSRQQSVSPGYGEASAREEHKDQMEQAHDQWGGLMEMLGLNGAGDMAGNLGYTLGMLPDMIYAMLTGKSDKLKIENNVFPLMAIFGGMFLKNPLLKWLMIGLGATNILNKGFGEYSGRDAAQVRQVSYKRYPDESLSSRIVFHGEKDGRFIVDIDGKATTFAVSEATMAAYKSGALPLNTLLNVALGEFDANEREMRRQYDMKAQQEQDRQVVRMGVG